MKIALVAKAGCGKTTAAQYLVDKHGFVRMAFADKLKEICISLWPEKFENGNKPRELLQTFGTDMVRKIDDNTWINNLIRRIRKMPKANIVVEDCRYLNEVKALSDEGFLIIKIVGPERGVYATKGECRNHSSETEQEQIQPDKIIENIGSVEDLYRELDIFLWAIDSSKRWDEYPGKPLYASV